MRAGRRITEANFTRLHHQTSLGASQWAAGSDFKAASSIAENAASTGLSSSSSIGAHSPPNAPTLTIHFSHNSVTRSFVALKSGSPLTRVQSRPRQLPCRSPLPSYRAVNCFRPGKKTPSKNLLLQGVIGLVRFGNVFEPILFSPRLRGGLFVRSDGPRPNQQGPSDPHGPRAADPGIGHPAPL